MGRRPKDAPRYEDLIDQIIAEYQAGKSLRDIARPPERKITTPTVKEWLARAGVKTRSTGEGTRLRLQREGGRLLRDVSEEQLRTLYLEELWSPHRIAQHLGVDRGVIELRIRKYGLVRSKEQKAQARKVSSRLRKDTCTERYGGISPNYSQEVRDRTAKTNTELYGAANPFATEHVKERIEATHLARRGVVNPAWDPDVIEKRRATNRERYGADHHRQASWDERTKKVLSSRGSLESFLDDTGLDTVLGIARELGVDTTTIQLRLHHFDLWGRINHRYRPKSR
jgi:hypothetical protein